MYYYLPFVAAVASVAPLLAQTERKMTARELFYTPVVDVKSDTKPQAAKPPKPVKSRPEPAAPKAPTETAKTQPAPPVDNVSHQEYTPLALRYSLLKSASGDDYNEVNVDTVFRSGDKLKVAVEANDASYLYIVQQGSSKTWNLLFPNTEVEAGSNRVERNHKYVIPSQHRFVFDEQPGTERMFIVLSRRPEPDLEKLIYDLSQAGGEAASPASTPSAAPEKKMLLASARPIDDAVVNRLRSQLVSRDLVFEKVDESAGKKEKAMYVASKDRSGKARLVVDVNLKHR
jgi:hypothetical protein